MLDAVTLECICSSARIHSLQSCDVGVIKHLWVLESLVLKDNNHSNNNTSGRKKSSNDSALKWNLCNETKRSPCVALKIFDSYFSPVKSCSLVATMDSVCKTLLKCCIGTLLQCASTFLRAIVSPYRATLLSSTLFSLEAVASCCQGFLFSLVL